MIGWLIRKWRERQRAMDLAFLWPACKERADSIAVARMVFATHARRDSAYDDFSDDALLAYIMELK